jgi:hypothetical protein
MLSSPLYVSRTMPVGQPLAYVATEHSTDSRSAWARKATNGCTCCLTKASSEMTQRHAAKNVRHVTAKRPAMLCPVL